MTIPHGGCLPPQRELKCWAFRLPCSNGPLPTNPPSWRNIRWRHAVCQSLLGNAFHVPSCMLALCTLFSLLPTCSAVPPATYVGLEKHIRSAAMDTAWQPGVVESLPGVLCWKDLSPMIQASFWSCDAVLPPLQASPAVDRALARLQIYWVDTQLRGLGEGPQGLNGFSKRVLAPTSGPWVPKLVAPTLVGQLLLRASVPTCSSQPACPTRLMRRRCLMMMPCFHAVPCAHWARASGRGGKSSREPCALFLASCSRGSRSLSRTGVLLCLL